MEDNELIKPLEIAERKSYSTSWSYLRTYWFLNTDTKKCEQYNSYEYNSNCFSNKYECEDKCLDSPSKILKNSYFN